MITLVSISLVVALLLSMSALTHSEAARNAASDSVVDLIDVGSADAAGDLVIGTTGMSLVLATIDLPNPAFLAASSGTATADTISDGTASGTGEAAAFQIRNRDNTVVFSGTVTGTGGGGDIELDNINIVNGQTVSISSATYTGESQ